MGSFSTAIPLHIFNLLNERIQSGLSASPQGPQNPAGVHTSHFLQQPRGREFTGGAIAWGVRVLISMTSSPKAPTAVRREETK